ncbi:MAG: MBL fold metallo-hydrolase [Eubacteriales bacterium]|nr:MBL fold metallo-hydrolase [Eubacteriales bacterium]
MKIINLVEDTKGGNCLNEHGLSFYIETEKHKLLMDSGATDLFLQNAGVLGVDLTQVDTFILSHGHYDHAGGLSAFAQLNPKAEIYLKETAGGDYYHISSRGGKYIGIDKNIMNLPQVITVQDNLEIDEELFLLTGFSKKQYPAWSNLELKEKVGNAYIQDGFSHEQCLLIRQGEHQTLLSGCAHSGILSILDRYYELFGSFPQTVISGFHMMKNSGYLQEEFDYIRQTAHELLETEALFYTGHCTGQKAFDIMKEIMGERLQDFHSGSQLEI